jgi:aspartyl-tRNA(Asn)/glutamyl-tRNA(Gln) amidotransferase subunit A
MPEPPQSARELAAAIAAGQQSAIATCDAALARIEQLDPAIHAFLQLFPDQAREAAAAVDAARDAGRPLGPLAGVPIALKDNLCYRVGRTTCASRILAPYASPYNATAVEKILAAGAVVVGKTNLDEFAMGSSTEHTAFEPTRNPWNTNHVPGGSSGGSAAAVAARLTPIALGSDTGGSIRQPASFCGVVGLKPTYGRVSRYGLVAFGSSLDQIGPFATNVTDVALLTELLCGHDPRDSTSVDQPAPQLLSALDEAELDRRQVALRIGVPTAFLAAGIDPEVRAVFEAALAEYERLGAQCVEIALPRAEFGVAAYYVIAPAEASSNLARFDGVRYGHRAADPQNVIDLYSRSREQGFGAEVKRRIMLGTFALSAGYYDAYYDKASRVRRLLREDFEQAFEQVDVIASPAAPTAAFALGEKEADPLAMYLADALTIPANLAGIPGISIPAGFNGAGLPVGLQLLAPHFEEAGLLQAARLFERATDHHTRAPALQP